MVAQVAETQTRAELNKAQTRAADAQTLAANEKFRFWEQANAALMNKSLVLTLRSDTNQIQPDSES